jgi:Sugar (and other) transporter
MDLFADAHDLFVIGIAATLIKQEWQLSTGRLALFGPNVTTFVLPSEVFPVTMRATGHGISAGVGKLGALAGVFAFPLLQASLGLRGTLLFTAGISVLGLLLTLTLPEPARRTLDEVSSGEQLPEVASGEQPPEVAALSQPPAGDPLSSSLVSLGSSAARRPVPPDRAACGGLAGAACGWLGGAACGGLAGAACGWLGGAACGGLAGAACGWLGGTAAGAPPVTGSATSEPSCGWPSRAQIRLSSYW